MSHPLPRLLRHTRRHRGRLSLAALCSVLNKLFDLAPPVLIGATIDVFVRGEDSYLAGLGLVSPQAQIWALAGITLLIWGLESVFEYLYAVIWRNLAQTIQHELRCEAYEHVQGLDMAWFEERSTGSLMAVLNDDVNQLERFLDTGANDLLQVTTTAIAIGTAFLVIAWQVAWMAILPVPVIIWGSVRFQRLLAPRYARVRERVGELSHRLANNLGGISTVKVFTTEGHEAERVRAESRAYREANRDAIRLSSAFSPLIRMVIVLGFTGMMVGGAYLIWDNEASGGPLTVAAYSVLLFMTQRLLWPMTRLGQVFDLYQRAMASTARVLDLLETRPSIRDGERPFPRKELRGEIELEHVDFDYVPGTPVLRDLHLRLGAGQTTAFVGPTGSGKSTLVKLLLRLHDPTAGRVLLDGRPLDELRLADLRALIGLVNQDVFLFHGTVSENIAYGCLDASREQIEAAARIAEADEFIRDLPLGYRTVVGERGQKLSGGQRQRVSLARAILKGAPILVLDEATSAVDNETEAAIQRSLERIARDHTMIVIAHRLSTVRHADRIYVLDGGRIREEGRHDELVALDGIYAALWRVQTGLAVGAELHQEIAGG